MIVFADSVKGQTITLTSGALTSYKNLDIEGPGPANLTISGNGDMDKLDPSLAARQIAFLADLATRLDPIPAAQLLQGDPTLGAGGSAGPRTDKETRS